MGVVAAFAAGFEAAFGGALDGVFSVDSAADASAAGIDEPRAAATAAADRLRPLAPPRRIEPAGFGFRSRAASNRIAPSSTQPRAVRDAERREVFRWCRDRPSPECIN